MASALDSHVEDGGRGQGERPDDLLVYAKILGASRDAVEAALEELAEKMAKDPSIQGVTLGMIYAQINEIRLREGKESLSPTERYLSFENTRNRLATALIEAEGDSEETGVFGGLEGDEGLLGRGVVGPDEPTLVMSLKAPAPKTTNLRGRTPPPITAVSPNLFNLAGAYALLEEEVPGDNVLSLDTVEKLATAGDTDAIELMRIRKNCADRTSNPQPPSNPASLTDDPEPSQPSLHGAPLLPEQLTPTRFEALLETVEQYLPTFTAALRKVMGEIDDFLRL
ncbi:hypothetical protein IPG41_00205 [Candidatus Peregrinibacteria bacterium]|nr:MAG: hypothetical protein IPG41_00205 [Candidatus Peregrinibacteria bacterium]